MHRLAPRVMHYAWGSREVIAGLTGREGPTQEPEAELWMGAHEQAPSGVQVEGRQTTLDQWITTDPAALLGDSCVEAFGGRLPFLLKILAPSRPLSIQCHPDAAQACDAAPGTYVDGSPKPEAWLAVTEFEIFAGLRPFEQMEALATDLGAGDLVSRVRAAADDGRPMYRLLSNLLRLEGEERVSLVRNVVAACCARAHAGGDGSVSVVARASELFADDIGLVVLLLMQHRVLEPGSYVYVPAGVLHAPVGGTTVEILANSDNVVRAGLTPKPINIEELLRIVDVDKTMEPARPLVSGRASTYPTDAAHFQLHTVEPGDDEHLVPGDGSPRILLALHGPVTLQSTEETLGLAAGESCFVPAFDGPIRVSGPGELYVATTGPSALHPSG